MFILNVGDFVCDELKDVMPNHVMQCSSCRVIFLVVILMITSNTSPSEDDQVTEKISIAKRNFLSREKDYLKERPLSDDLRSFIRRFKRKASKDLGKNKREEQEHMFVVHNGNIEPLVNISDVTYMPASNPSGIGNFTVIPLVIPITIETFTNATICENNTETTEETSSEYMKIRPERFTDKTETEKPTEEKTEKTTSTTSTTPTTKETENSLASEKIVDNALSTTESENMKYLDKVLTDVEELISYEKEGRSGNNEGAMCTVIGDWDSKVGGMQLRIFKKNESNNPVVCVTEQEPAAQDGFLRTGNWNVTLQMPYNHSSMIILTAVSKNEVASFIGDCRICEGADTISGNWMLARRSLNCKDQQETHSFFSDVLRKDNVRRLRKEHLKVLSTRNLVSTPEI